MLFSDWVKLPDLEKLIIVEMEIAKEIEGEIWTATGAGSYWCNFPSAINGEVVVVKENGVAYSSAGSIANCDATASSFYFDFANKRLYVHTSGNDSPDTKIGADYKYCLLAYFWRCIANQAIIYIPQNATQPVFYLPYLSPASMSAINQSVGDYYVGSINIQFGELVFLNDGFWYTEFKNFIYHNKRTYIKIGARDSLYNELETIFYGKVRKPYVDDEYASLEAKDARISTLREIPINKFWKSNYANLEDKAEGLSIPILFGQAEGIVPTCIDTMIFKYKICDYAIEAISAVYKDERLLIIVADYTVDLANGEFTLVADPEDALISCDAKGIKPNYFGAGATYAEIAADFLYYVLNFLNGISQTDLDQPSFDDLRGARTQKLACYLNWSMQTIDFIRLLQASAVFHHIPMLNGKHGAFRYTTGAAGAPVLYKEDFGRIGILYDTDSVYKKVSVKYRRNPYSGEWLSAEASEVKVGYRYDEENTLPAETLLRDKIESENLAAFYLSIVKSPPKKIDGEISAVGLNMRPAEKIIVNKDFIDLDGNKIVIFASEVYRILEHNKNFELAKDGIIGVDDLQSIGGYHADIPHQDDAHSDHDDHSDVVHQDHQDHQDGSYYDYRDHSDHLDGVHQDHGDHLDEAYQDHSDHSDVPHEDHYDHDDLAHNDHNDVFYIDIPHGDSGPGYEDVIHEDHNDHQDGAYQDHSDHSDVPHSDHSDHTDAWDDVPHQDHNDHGDSGHSDHNDHSDAPHGDEPHYDSEY